MTSHPCPECGRSNTTLESGPYGHTGDRVCADCGHIGHGPTFVSPVADISRTAIEQMVVKELIAKNPDISQRALVHHARMMLDTIAASVPTVPATAHPFQIKKSESFVRKLKWIIGEAVMTNLSGNLSTFDLIKHEDKVADVIMRVMRQNGWLK